MTYVKRMGETWGYLRGLIWNSHKKITGWASGTAFSYRHVRVAERGVEVVPGGGVPCTRNLLGVTSNGYGSLTILPLLVYLCAVGFRFLLGNWEFMGVSLAFTEWQLNSVLQPYSSRLLLLENVIFIELFVNIFFLRGFFVNISVFCLLKIGNKNCSWFYFSRNNITNH